jgi:putative ABC transport system permease protein
MVRLFGYVWRQLFQRKVRTALSMLGVSVAVAGIIALISVAQGMRSSLDRFMVESGASLIVLQRDAAGFEHSAVTQEEVDEIAAIEGVQDTSRATFKGQIFPKLGESHKKRPMLLVFGRYPEERLIQRYQDLLLEGSLPRERHEILVGKNVADESGIKLGDRMPLFLKEHFGIKEYEVVGIYETNISWENSGIVVHGDVVVKEAGKIVSLFLYTKESDRDRVRKTVNETYDHLVAVTPQEFMGRFATQMEVIDDFILLVTVIAMILGILGVLNTMMMSVSERTREIGMLRALGWSRGLVVKTILIEGMLLSLVGGVLGLGIGFAGTEILIMGFPGGWLDALYRPTTFLFGGAVALIVGALAALYPAVRAANLRPVEALRYE